MPKYFLLFGQVRNTSNVFNFLFCSLYKLHTSYFVKFVSFVKIGILGFVYFVYLVYYCFCEDVHRHATLISPCCSELPLPGCADAPRRPDGTRFGHLAQAPGSKATGLGPKAPTLGSQPPGKGCWSLRATASSWILCFLDFWENFK